jgi:hypothetical protein
MNPILGTMFLLINYLVQQCKHRKLPHQIHYVYRQIVGEGVLGKGSGDSSAVRGRGAYLSHDQLQIKQLRVLDLRTIVPHAF